MKTRFDIQFVRNNANEFDNRLSKRGIQRCSETILGLDESRRGHLHASEEARAAARTLQKEIGQLKKQGLPADELINKAARLNQGADEAAKLAVVYEERLEAIVVGLPN